MLSRYSVCTLVQNNLAKLPHLLCGELWGKHFWNVSNATLLDWVQLNIIMDHANAGIEQLGWEGKIWAQKK